MERYAHQKNKKKRKRKKKEISTTGKKENTGKKKCSKSDEKRHNKHKSSLHKKTLDLFISQSNLSDQEHTLVTVCFPRFDRRFSRFYPW